MIITYDECIISKQVIADAYDICYANPNLRAGVCCSSMQQLRDLEKEIDEIHSSCPPWLTELRLTRRSGSTHSEVIRFDNGSILEFFVATESCRGKRFHYIRVDENLDREVKDYMMQALVCDYTFDHPNIDADLADLLAFAEAMTHSPLPLWQKDMLIHLYNGDTFVTGRSLGKQTISAIYTEWRLKRENDCCPCEFTYDQIMAGIPSEPLGHD